MNKLKYCVTQSGYTAKVGDGVISQRLDGGASRYRRSLKNVSHTVNVQWVVGKGGYQYLMAFYRVWRRTPSQPFIARLLVDDGEVQDYKCFFIESPSLTNKEGNVHTVSAQLEVKPQPEDEAMDDLIVEIGNEGGSDDLWDWVNPLEELVNEDLPAAMEGL